MHSSAPGFRVTNAVVKKMPFAVVCANIPMARMCVCALRHLSHSKQMFRNDSVTTGTNLDCF